VLSAGAKILFTCKVIAYMLSQISLISAENSLSKNDFNLRKSVLSAGAKICEPAKLLLI